MLQTARALLQQVGMLLSECDGILTVNSFYGSL